MATNASRAGEKLGWIFFHHEMAPDCETFHNIQATIFSPPQCCQGCSPLVQHFSPIEVAEGKTECINFHLGDICFHLGCAFFHPLFFSPRLRFFSPTSIILGLLGFKSRSVDIAIVGPLGGNTVGHVGWQWACGGRWGIGSYGNRGVCDGDEEEHACGQMREEHQEF